MTSIETVSRNAILEAVGANQPPACPMPAIAHFPANQPADLVATFSKAVAHMAGEVVTDQPGDLNLFLRTRFPGAKATCSTVPEYAGTVEPASLTHWEDASTIDVSVVRSPMGVAETGSVLLSDLELEVNTIAYLAHDLVVLLDPRQIVANIHDAFEHPYFRSRPYSVLMTGPSGSGDISGVVVHPAQGVKTLTVIFSPEQSPGKRR